MSKIVILASGWFFISHDLVHRCQDYHCHNHAFDGYFHRSAAAAAASGVDQDGNHHLDDGNAELDNEHEEAKENYLSSGRQRRPHPRDLIGKEGHQRFEQMFHNLYIYTAHQCVHTSTQACKQLRKLQRGASYNPHASAIFHV